MKKLKRLYKELVMRKNYILLPKIILIEVDKSRIMKSGDYVDGRKCPIHNYLSEVLGKKDITVGTQEIKINGIEYTMDKLFSYHIYTFVLKNNISFKTYARKNSMKAQNHYI